MNEDALMSGALDNPTIQNAVGQAIMLQREEIFQKVMDFLPKILWAIAILVVWVIVSYLIYKLIMFLFRKFHIKQLIDKLELDFFEEQWETGEKWPHAEKQKKFTDKIRVDRVVAKATGYYIFLVFFRLAIVFIGIKEVEKFLGDLIAYLPSLFVGIVIGFFGIRFANFMYDVVYNTLELTKQKTSMIIAMGAKIIVLFFTLMLVLNYTQLVDEFIINTIFVGFIAMLALSGSLAFGLGGKEVAKEILESFRK